MPRENVAGQVCAREPASVQATRGYFREPRYFKRDIVPPEIVQSDGIVQVPERPGIGFEVDLEYMSSVTVFSERINSQG